MGYPKYDNSSEPLSTMAHAVFIYPLIPAVPECFALEHHDSVKILEMVLIHLRTKHPNTAT